jgi:hypothetical protein
MHKGCVIQSSASARLEDPELTWLPLGLTFIRLQLNKWSHTDSYSLYIYCNKLNLFSSGPASTLCEMSCPYQIKVFANGGDKKEIF